MFIAITRQLRFLPLALLALFLVIGTPALAAPDAELVADAETGKIIFGDNIYEERHPASLTKMMTLYVIFAALEQKRLTLNSRLPVSWRASVQAPSKLGLREGSSIRVRDAILSLVTQSANDISVVLAEAIGGSESRFAQIMTQQARALGMKRTTYQNASGLHDEDQVTTAFDQAILARALLYHFPKYYRYFSTRAFSYGGRTMKNHNHLMSRYKGMDGIKTGFIRPSGFNLAASARRNGVRLIGVVFGGQTAKSRDNRMAEILDAGFERAYAEKRSGAVYAAATPSPVDTGLAQGDADDDMDTVSSDDESSLALPATKPRSTKKPAREKSVSGKSWAIQIGTFKNRAQSLNAITKVQKRASKFLGGASPKVTTARSGNKTIFRARLTGLSETQARRACSRLALDGLNCLTLPPRG